MSNQQIEKRIMSKTSRDYGKVGEGKKPTGLFKRVAEAAKKSGMAPRNRSTVDPRY
jgi:hypothetical protein